MKMINTAQVKFDMFCKPVVKPHLFGKLKFVKLGLGKIGLDESNQSNIKLTRLKITHGYISYWSRVHRMKF